MDIVQGPVEECPVENPQPVVNQQDLRIQQLEEQVRVLTAALTELQREPFWITRWVHLPRPVSVGRFSFTSDSPVSYEIASKVPRNAKAIRIMTFLRCGFEPPERSFHMKFWTDPSRPHFTRGARYGQQAISFDTNSLDMVYSEDHQLLWVQCNDIQETNCHYIDVYLVGYL